MMVIPPLLGSCAFADCSLGEEIFPNTQHKHPLVQLVAIIFEATEHSRGAGVVHPFQHTARQRHVKIKCFLMDTHCTRKVAVLMTGPAEHSACPLHAPCCSPRPSRYPHIPSEALGSPSCLTELPMLRSWPVSC